MRPGDGELLGVVLGGPGLDGLDYAGTDRWFCGLDIDAGGARPGTRSSP